MTLLCDGFAIFFPISAPILDLFVLFSSALTVFFRLGRFLSFPRVNPFLNLLVFVSLLYLSLYFTLCS